MRRRIKVIGGLVAAVCAALAAVGWWIVVTFMPEAAIDIDQTQLQRRIEGYFPQKQCALLVACMTFSRPVVALAEDSPRVALSADVVVSLGRREMPGQVTFSGVLRYVRGEGDFYLDDVRVDKFALTGVSPEMVQVVKERGADALRRALQGHPVYSLRGDSAHARLVKLAVRDVRVVDGKLRVTFLRFGG